MKALRISIVLIFDFLALAGTLVLPGRWEDTRMPVTYAQGSDGYNVYYVAPGGNCDSGITPCYDNVQAAVDDADDTDDVIKVATGIYTGINNYGGLAQVVYISKTVTIRGGYTTTNWAMPYPITQPTTLDAQGQGRVLYVIGNVSPTVEGLYITGGDADGLRGGPPWGGDFGGGVYITTATASLSNNYVFSNTASFGGGLYLWRSAAMLNNNTVSSNTASWSGGGLLLYESTAILYGNTVTSNTAETYGGGLHVDYSSATLSENIITSNTAFYGGGLRLWHSAATLNGNTISFNSAVISGGGVCLDYSPATLNGNTITSNTADCGGGLTLDDSNAMLNGNTITSNTADWGGGLRLVSSDATLSSNTITSNTANICGGGLYLGSSDAMLSGNTITSNAADFSGGGLHLSSSDATLNSNAIASNAAKSGGGLHLSSSDATLRGNTITFNTAKNGGGLHLGSHSDATLTNNVIANNQAKNANSGLYITGGGGPPLPITGSGLYITGSSPRLLHTTLVHNSGGDGSGVYIASDGSNNSTVTLTNTILTSHTVGITVAANNTAILNSILWFGNEANTGGAGIITVTNAITGNPAFVLDGYHIISDSAAFNAGVDSRVRTDVDNQPRPYQSPDLGADEYWPPSALKYVYLPVVLRQHS